MLSCHGACASWRHLLLGSVSCCGACLLQPLVARLSHMSRRMPHGTCATCWSAGTAHAPTVATCCSAQSAVAEHALSPPICLCNVLLSFHGACDSNTMLLAPRVAQLSQRMRLVHYAACELRSHGAGVLSSVLPQSYSLLEKCQSRNCVTFKTFRNLESKIVWRISICV